MDITRVEALLLLMLMACAINNLHAQIVFPDEQPVSNTPTPTVQHTQAGLPPPPPPPPGQGSTNVSPVPRQPPIGHPPPNGLPPPRNGHPVVGGGHVSGGAHVPNAQIVNGGSALVFPREEKLRKVPCRTAAGHPGLCRLLVQCAVYFAEMAVLSRSPCQINNNQKGVCCPNIARPTMDTNSIVNRPPKRRVKRPHLEMKQINFAVQQSKSQIQQRNDKERELVFNDIVAQPNTPVFLHCRLFDTNANVLDKAEKATLTLGATLNMVKDFGLTKEEAESGLSEFNVNNTIIADTCPPEPICLNTKYRSVDGSCNNLRHKDWGQAATAYQRIIIPDYSDGVNSPRVSKIGLPLPSPRALSQKLFETRDDIYFNFTMMIMQWGQFLAHDITHTPISKGEGFADISCCSRGEVRPAQHLHPECLPIEIPADDPFYAQFAVRCMEFTRSMPAIRRECKFGSREQMNQISAYIDASNVYGSSPSVTTNLREGRQGRLRITNHNGRDLLPGDVGALGCGGRSRNAPPCFKAGDVRVNEQPDLVVLHTVWMRQHNKVAGELARLNRGWNDETIYQEARRIIAAQMQHITYNEYLPIVLGQQFMVSFGLVPQSDGFATNYLDTADATINNAFATAAFRYGHTLVPGNIEGYSKFGTVDRDLSLSQSQFAPFFLYEEGSFDSMLRGLSIQHSEKFDTKFTRELVNRLFAQNGSFGMDLGALNIQRGRDHGLPSYNVWRKTCHLPEARSFGDLADVMTPQAFNKLAAAYNHVDDIDLFVGGLMEIPKAGSLLGHTFLCIVGDQFARLKLGDRFYYENGGLTSSFSEAQLDQIRKTSMARIFCDNSDEIQTMQPLAFVQGNLPNKRVSCTDDKNIPRVSLDPWTNDPVSG